MTATTSEYNLDEPELPRIRKLDRNAPMRWVSQGLNDLKTSRLNSIILILILILILLRPAWSRLAAMVLVFFLTTAHWFRGAGERFMMMLISCHLSVLSHFVGRCWRDSYSVSACSPSHTSHIGRSRSGPRWAAMGRDAGTLGNFGNRVLFYRPDIHFALSRPRQLARLPRGNHRGLNDVARLSGLNNGPPNSACQGFTLIITKKTGQFNPFPVRTDEQTGTMRRMQPRPEFYLYPV